MRKISFKTYAFGCRVNQAEETIIQQQMQKAGFVWSNDPDIYILNTCAITQKAEREARQHINQVKKSFPKCFLAVTGCSLTNWIKNGWNNDKIDLNVNNIDKQYLVKLISRRFLTDKKTKKEEIPNKYLTSGRIFLKIQDGCHRFCTYCIVPYLRGAPKSFSINSIITQINKLPKNIHEVVLTAINTEDFGTQQNENLTQLSAEILKKTQIPRLSFGSINPWSLNNKFFKFYETEVLNRKKWGRFVDFFHVPLQSGSQNILNLMKRDYTPGEYLEKINKIHQINPQALIAADVIVGFLGESEREFEETYQFIKNSPISRLHVFRFSIRDHTAAFYMQKRFPKLSSKIINQRSKLLLKLSSTKFKKFQKTLIGKNFSCLILKKINKEYYKGLLSNQVEVMVKNDGFVSPSIIEVKVNHFKKNILYASYYQ